MSYFIIETEESSAFEGNAPSSDAINNAISGITLPTGSAWVGPRARITRVTHVGSALAGFVTRVARLLSVNVPMSGLTDAATADYVGNQINFALAFLSGNWSVATVTAWSAAVNGPVTWWDNGTAAVTQTENEFPTLGGRLDAAENTIGPTSNATHPGTLGGAIAGTGSTLTTLGFVALGILALWTVAPILRGTRAERVARSRRAAEKVYRR